MLTNEKMGEEDGDVGKEIKSKSSKTLRNRYVLNHENVDKIWIDFSRSLIRLTNFEKIFMSETHHRVRGGV